MEVKIKNIDLLEKYINLVPSILLEDVDKRISDWLSFGGSLDDDYIQQQYNYIERYIAMKDKFK